MSDAGTASAPAPKVERWRAPEHNDGAGGQRHGLLTAAQLAAIEEQARAEGYRCGLEEGREAGKAEMLDKARRLEALIAAVEPQASILDDTLIEQLGELVFAIARQLVRRELSRQPGEVVRVVREAIAVLPASQANVSIFLNPNDVALVTEALQPETASHPIRIVEDLSMSPGGARIETDVSVVDASVEARLGAIAAQVFGDDRDFSTAAEPPDDDAHAD